MDLYIKGFIKDYTKQISSKIFRTSNKLISYVNDIFVNLFESASYCILNIKDIFDSFSDNSLNKFLNELNLFSNIMMKANIELRLTLKQILFILDFIEVKEFFFNNGINLKKYLKEYLSILQEENDLYLMPQYINTKKYDINQDIIKEEFSFLKKIILKEKKYPELISKLLNNKIKVSKDEKYKINILKIL